MVKKQSGFSLVEILLMVAIITTLAVTVFVALDPTKRLTNTRDARRDEDVQNILIAIHKSIIESKGSLPSGLTTGMAETQIGTGVSGCAIATGGCNVVATACVDLTTPMVKYLKTIPIDPSDGTTYTSAKTGYSVQVDSNGIVTVKACGTEGSTSISVSR